MKYEEINSNILTLVREIILIVMIIVGTKMESAYLMLFIASYGALLIITYKKIATDKIRKKNE
jgi:hypothetical protein